MSVHRAIRLTTLATVANFVLSFISVIVVSRLLNPQEIGVFSVAVSLIAYTHILREFGVGQYFVQLKEITREHLRSGFTIMLIISWSIALLLFLVREPVSIFYGHDGLAALFAVLALNFIILPFGSPILSILKRDMQFGRLAIVSISNSIVQVTVTIATAMAGESYMSMAWGSIAGNVTNVVLLSLMRLDLALLLPTSRGLSAVLSFGSKSSAGSLIGQLGSSGPDLILGKTLGFEAVANYSRATSLNNMILGKVNEIVGQVFFPAFAQGIRNGSAPASMYCSSMLVVTGVVAPLMGVLAFLAQPLILFFFGPQWHEAATLATYLCLFQLVRAPVAFAANALVAGGYVGAVLRGETISQVTALFILVLTIWLDLQTVVYLLLIARLVNLGTFANILKRHYAITYHALWSAMLPSYKLIPITLFGPFALELGLALGNWSIPPFLYLCAASLLALGGYVAGIRMLKHPVREELIRLAPPLSALLGSTRRTPG
jgi:O-antigen/teichoic acid export membrane protein